MIDGLLPQRVKEDSGIVEFHQPDTLTDSLSELAREGARRLLAEALSAEAEAYVAALSERRPPDGRQGVVRHGQGPERAIQMGVRPAGVGPVRVRRPKVRDRDAGGGQRARRRSMVKTPSTALAVRP